LKKRSAASSTSEPPEPLVLFVDRSLGNKVVANALRLAGARVEIHDDHFPTTALDEEWLGVVGQRGWVVLTKDRGIRYRAPALTAIRASAIRMFVLTAGDLQGHEMAAIFARGLARIAGVARRERAPFIAKITKTGVVSLLVSARELR
jgi:PIN like domain